MIRAFRLAFKRHAVRAIVFLGIVTQARTRSPANHVSYALQSLDRTVRAENAIAKSVMFVAESRLPGHNQIAREVERHRDRVGYLATILFREYPARHVRRRRKRQVERTHDPRDLVNHVLGHVAARELPE